MSWANWLGRLQSVVFSDLRAFGTRAPLTRPDSLQRSVAAARSFFTSSAVSSRQ